MSVLYTYTGNFMGRQLSDVYAGDTISLEIVGIPIYGTPTVELYLDGVVYAVGTDISYSSFSLICTIDLDTQPFSDLFYGASDGSVRTVNLSVDDGGVNILCDSFEVTQRCVGGSGDTPLPPHSGASQVSISSYKTLESINVEDQLHELKDEVDDLNLGGAVDSVNGKTGDVVLTKSDISLGNVDNTSDLSKPVSTAQQLALNGKLNSVSAGLNITIDYTDPNNPIISASGVIGGAVDSVNGKTGVVTLNQDEIPNGSTYVQYSLTEQSKLSGVEPGATADQSDSEIETAYNNQVPVVSQVDAEAGVSTTVYRWTPERIAQAIAALESPDGGGAVDSVNSQTGVVVLDQDDIGDGLTYAQYSLVERSKLSGIEPGATADQTGAEIKVAYESEANTNAFTDADHSKLDGVELGAEVNNISDINATDLTDGGDSSLHYHSSDRDRSNHTGTQLSSTISDFDTGVSNNSSVLANTAKVTNATHTGEVTGSTSLTIDSTAISNKPVATLSGSMEVLVNDSGTLRKTTAQDIADLGSGGGGSSYPWIPSSTVDFSTTHAVLTANASKKHRLTTSASGFVVATLPTVGNTDGDTYSFVNDNSGWDKYLEISDGTDWLIRIVKSDGMAIFTWDADGNRWV